MAVALQAPDCVMCKQVQVSRSGGTGLPGAAA